MAVGCYLEGGASGPRENARLQLEADGPVSVFVGSSAVGQGVETVFAQIAADALEMPMERIKGVFHGSTDYRQRRLRLLQLALGGDGRLGHRRRGRASCAMRSATAAAKRLGCAADGRSTIVNDTAVGPGRSSVPLQRASRGISADGTYASNKRTYSYGAHAAHVAVDPKTGQVEVIDYVAVEDVGRIINPADAARPVRRRDRAGPRRRAARALRL